MHGARGGAKTGPANSNWKHGGRSREAIAMSKLANALGRDARKFGKTLFTE